MARIVGVDIPNDKPVKIALTYIYGIGRFTANQICESAKVDGMIRVKDLTDDQFAAIRNEIAKYKTEGDLRREVALNIKRLTEINCYRGLRHRRGSRRTSSAVTSFPPAPVLPATRISW